MILLLLHDSQTIYQLKQICCPMITSVAQCHWKICPQDNVSRGHIFLGCSVLLDNLARIKCLAIQEYLSYPRIMCPMSHIMPCSFARKIHPMYVATQVASYSYKLFCLNIYIETERENRFLHACEDLVKQLNLSPGPCTHMHMKSVQGICICHLVKSCMLE